MSESSIDVNNTESKQLIVSVMDGESNIDNIETGILINKFIGKINDNTNEILAIFKSMGIYGTEPGHVSNITYKQYSDLGLPLYLTHALITITRDIGISLAKNITVTIYENLTKEKSYIPFRITDQIIIMWKRLSKNMDNNEDDKYALLSFISNDMDELNFNQTKYFIYTISINEIESWKNFNMLTKTELYSENRLMSFRDAIVALINY